ncbi:MAG: hypothetical protein ACRDRH_21440 [Pseudonocardia sp.]
MAEPTKTPEVLGFGNYDVSKVSAEQAEMIKWFVDSAPEKTGDAAHAIVDVRREQAREIES